MTVTGVFLNHKRVNVCEHTCDAIFVMFTYMHSLLNEKDACDRRNILIMFQCVCVCLSYGDLFNFWKEFFPFLSLILCYCERKEVNNKVNKFQRMLCTINRTLKEKTQLSTQIKLYNVMAVPVLMYGSENWSLNRSDKRKIEAAEMRSLRMAGYTLLDKKRSSDMREQLDIFNINDKLTQYKINRREHMQRMDDNRLPKTILNYKLEGRRNIGRPLTRW